jgi:Ca2+-binding RTX toxin-like protein
MTTINPAIGTTNTINGTNGDDNVHISKAPGLLGLLGLYEVNVNGNVQFMTKNQLEHTDFKLGDGDDTLVVDANVTAGIHAEGGNGNDTLIGGAGNDVFNGGNGNDTLWGRGGVNTMDGDAGRDTLINTSGINIDFGGGGKDTFLNIGGTNLDIGGAKWDTFLNLGGTNIDVQ